MYNFETKEELIRFVNDEIVNTSEALEILECSRQNLNKLVKSGTLVPIKEMVRDKLFFKEDILRRKEQMKKVWKVSVPYEYMLSYLILTNYSIEKIVLDVCFILGEDSIFWIISRAKILSKSTCLYGKDIIV